MTGRTHELTRQRLLASLYNRQSTIGNSVFVELNTQVSPTRVRLPDIALVPGDARWDAKGEMLISPPALVIEIISPGQKTKDLLEKIGDYLAFGVPKIYIVDPFAKIAYECEGIRFDQWHQVRNLMLPNKSELDLQTVFG